MDLRNEDILIFSKKSKYTKETVFNIQKKFIYKIICSLCKSEKHTLFYHYIPK